MGDATMQAPGAERAMKAVLKWAEREAWQGVCDEIFQAHVEDACDLLDIDPDRLADEVGPDIYTTLLLWAIEDFLTRRFEPEGSASSTTTCAAGDGRKAARSRDICAAWPTRWSACTRSWRWRPAAT